MFTGQPKTKTNIYIYIAYHLPIYEVNVTARYLPRHQKHPYKTIYQQMVSTCLLTGVKSMNHGSGVCPSSAPTHVICI